MAERRFQYKKRRDPAQLPTNVEFIKNFKNERKDTAKFLARATRSVKAVLRTKG